MAENKNIKGKINELAVYHTDAYALAVANGYKGTLVEWLDSLVGKSAYEIAVMHGFDGTEEEWLDSLPKPEANKQIARIEAKGNEYLQEFTNIAEEVRSNSEHARQSAVSASGSALTAMECAEKAVNATKGLKHVEDETLHIQYAGIDGETIVL